MSISVSHIGDKIRVETTFKETLSGEVYCIDNNAGILVLRKKLEGADDYDVTMIKTDYITNIEVEQKGRLEDFVLPSISPSTIMRKEKSVENEMRNRKLPSFDPYGNYVFAHLSKFTVCQWEGNKIIVNNNVTIDFPYSADKVSGDEKGVKEVREWLVSMD
ncbi:hypothetical protein WA577_003914 [Blastocystis sp. JDR]